MSRLYYDPPKKPKLQGGNAENESSSQSTKEYLEKVAKIIPAEIIAGYLAIVGLIPLIKNTALHQGFYYGAFLFCAILTPVYFSRQAEKGKPKTMHILLSTLSFIIWAYTVTGEKVIPNFFSARKTIAQFILK